MASLFICAQEAGQLLGLREEEKGAGLFLFCTAKAKMPSRGREIFPSGKILVADSSPGHKIHKHPACAGFYDFVPAGALFLFERSERQKPRGGVAQNFRQEIYAWPQKCYNYFMTIFEQIFFNLGPIIFGLAGLVVAIYVYTKKKTSQPMVCPLNGECDVVTRSEYSKFFGLPVELMGILYYGLVIFVYVLHNLIPWLLSDTVIFLMTGVTIGAFIFSLYLVFIQAFVLKKWCTWCLFSAGFSTFIFVTAVFGANIDLSGLLSEYKTVIVVLHALSAAVGVGAATVTDIFFFRFLKDYRISESEQALMKTLSNVIWFALGMIIVTGIGLFIPRSEELLQSSKFLIKMVAVAVVTLNGVALNFLVSPKMMLINFGGAHDHQAGELHFMRKLSFALGAISISGWYLIFILGSLKSIPVSFGTALALYALVLCFAVTASQLMDRKMVRDYSKNHHNDKDENSPKNENF